MIRYSVMYPNEEGKFFDLDYYITKHMAIVKSLPEVRGVTVEAGISAKEPGTRAPFICIANIYYEDEAAFRRSFEPNSARLRADIVNFSDIEPVREIGRVADHVWFKEG